MYDTALELYNDFLGTYYHKCYGLSHDKRKRIESKSDPKDLFLDRYDYSVWLENTEELTNKEESEDFTTRR